MARKEKKTKAAPRARRATAAPAPEVLEEVGGGLGIDDGIVLSSTLLLALALALVIIAKQAYAS